MQLDNSPKMECCKKKIFFLIGKKKYLFFTPI